MVKPYKIDDSVICDNLIPIETRGKSKPIILNNPTVLVTPNQFNQNNMANETATTNAISGKMTFFFLIFLTLFTPRFDLQCSFPKVEFG